MCGILGFVISKDASFEPQQVRPLLERLFLLSESRGKDASGLAVAGDGRMEVLKRPVRPRRLIRTPEYGEVLRRFTASLQAGRPPAFAVMGHARMVTNGGTEIHENNQPVVKHGMVAFHNGIVVNDKDIWPRLDGIAREFEVDTEAILSLTAHYRKQPLSLVDALCAAFRRLEGANSIALLSSDLDALVLATTNGSLYWASCDAGRIILYASERYILERILRHRALRKLAEGNGSIRQLSPQTGCILPFDSMSPTLFSLREGTLHADPKARRVPREILDLRPSGQGRGPQGTPSTVPSFKNRLADEKLLAIDGEAIASLRRCSRCLLPETFPFIDFDREGVCNYCRNYAPVRPEGREALERLLQPARSGGRPDCIIPFSGGRDSSYGLHYMKREMGMNPVAYTYDWGMVTDLARRNISRVCGALGIEHILISADIRAKRENIRRNVEAWLKKPDIGTVPLFMAGDKQFFYYANMLRRQMDIGLILFCVNPLERTDFKSGFCGIRESWTKKVFWNLSHANKARLACHYGSRFMSNPAYLNRSLFDTLFAFLSYYILPKDFDLLYHYIRWDEKEVEETLEREYNWERANDTKSTWRIGDGTAAFYNYIYYRVAGFTENDTFRSNQIREGLVGRSEALSLVREENRPRLESIEWYCRTIGIDWRGAIGAVNAMPTLYASGEGLRRHEHAGPAPGRREKASGTVS